MFDTKHRIESNPHYEDGLSMKLDPVSSEQIQLEVLNPRGSIAPPPPLQPASRIDLTGNRKIGLYWNGKAGADYYMDSMAELFSERLPGIEIIRFEGPLDPGDDRALTMAEQADAFVYGIGD